MAEPITIKGGSVEIDFDDNVFPPSSGKKHYNSAKKITSVAITDDNTNQVTTCVVPSNGKCTITILCD
jgi:hypothetical protein